ncbi:sigma-54 interaction domain-containing protein [Eubacteriales bacterium KG127]
MLKNTLSKALNYYETFHDILIADYNGIIEYSSVYDRNKERFVNEDITGMHILDVYPELTEKDSSILKCLRTGHIIYDTPQLLTSVNGVTSYYISTDFPIISKGKTIGVVETSREVSRDEFFKFIDKGIGRKQDLYTLEDIKTENRKLLLIKSTVLKVANSPSSVLIIGETGTGKDMIAQSLHSESYRRNKPFVSQNCAAIPSTLLESTFFGTVKGAFTGAENSKGLFELANGGTIFLDEINSMDMYLQAKILKVVEDKSFRPIGASETKKVDIRIISAMNENPEELIKQGRFREDLFYRLGVVTLNIPALRDRKEDIKYISKHYIDVYNKIFNKNVSSMSAIVQDVLDNHNWNGNVRELQNVMEFIFNFIDKDRIQIEDLPNYLYRLDDNSLQGEKDYSNGGSEVFLNISNEDSLNKKLEKYEKSLIKKALSETDSLKNAAERLQISEPALQYKLRKYNLK